MTAANVKRAWKDFQLHAIVAEGLKYPTVPASRVVSKSVTDMPSGTVSPGCL